MSKSKHTELKKLPPQLSILLNKDTISLACNNKTLHLSQKWIIFYTLLAIHHTQHISTDDICDHHPWSRLAPSIAGRDLWRFIREQEEKYFGQRITQSPARQATKLFTLSAEITEHLQFYPNRPTIADHLRSLKIHRNSITNQLSECTLLIQSDLAALALERLREMQKQPLNTNESAHVEALISMCIDELYGILGNNQQISLLESLLKVTDLNRINRIRILICLARFYTFKDHYDTAKSYFTQLRHLVAPEDSIEYCWYHIYYGIFLKEIKQLDQATYHQRLAHGSAQARQWWHGVYAARYHLALIFRSLADKSSRSARQKYLQDALEWAKKAHDIALLNRKLTHKAEVSLLIAQIHRQSENWLEAKQWLDICLETNFPQPSKYDAHMSTVYQEIALTEEALHNHFSATIAHQTAVRHKEKANSIEQKLSLISFTE